MRWLRYILSLGRLGHVYRPLRHLTWTLTSRDREWSLGTKNRVFILSTRDRQWVAPSRES